VVASAKSGIGVHKLTSPATSKRPHRAPPNICTARQTPKQSSTTYFSFNSPNHIPSCFFLYSCPLLTRTPNSLARNLFRFSPAYKRSLCSTIVSPLLQRDTSKTFAQGVPSTGRNKSTS